MSSRNQHDPLRALEGRGNLPCTISLPGEISYARTTTSRLCPTTTSYHPRSPLVASDMSSAYFEVYSQDTPSNSKVVQKQYDEAQALLKGKRRAVAEGPSPHRNAFSSPSSSIPPSQLTQRFHDRIPKSPTHWSSSRLPRSRWARSRRRR